MINLHARGWRRPLLEVLFWIFVVCALGVLALGVWMSWLIVSGLGLVALGVLVYGGFIEPRWIRVTNYTVGEGEKRVRLVFLSDFHAGLKKQRSFYQRIANRVKELQPEIVVLGGDFVDESAKDLAQLAPIFDLRPSLGVWFVLGNHDFLDAPKELTDELLKLGARSLTNQVKTFPLAPEQSFELVGLDDSLFGSPDLRLVEKPKKGIRVIAMHEPDLLLDLPENCADVVLLGHTHGGQIRLPIRGPVLGLPQIAPQSLDAGEKSWRGMRVLISRGIGEALVRARLGVRPEILALDILAKDL